MFGTDMYSAQSERDWAELWQRYVESEEFERTSIWDVGLLCELGWNQAARRGDWQQAQHCIERYFQHPRWEQDDPTVLVTLQARRARTYAECGDETSALRDWALVKAQTKPYNRLPVTLVWSELIALCQNQDPDAVASEPFATFAWETASAFSGKMLPVPQSNTFSALASLLESAQAIRARRS